MDRAAPRPRHGAGAGEQLSREDLIEERFRGIRPAFGYPASPDHTEKKTLFALLDANAIGMSLTESLAMSPAASVCGFYLSHPQSTYFNVGRVGPDQVKDLAQRQGVAVDDLQRMLAPNL